MPPADDRQHGQRHCAADHGELPPMHQRERRHHQEAQREPGLMPASSTTRRPAGRDCRPDPLASLVRRARRAMARSRVASASTTPDRANVAKRVPGRAATPRSASAATADRAAARTRPVGTCLRARAAHWHVLLRERNRDAGVPQRVVHTGLASSLRMLTHSPNVLSSRIEKSSELGRSGNTIAGSGVAATPGVDVRDSSSRSMTARVTGRKPRPR